MESSPPTILVTDSLKQKKHFANKKTSSHHDTHWRRMHHMGNVMGLYMTMLTV